jgi:hypothetical protein
MVNNDGSKFEPFFGMIMVGALTPDAIVAMGMIMLSERGVCGQIFTLWTVSLPLAGGRPAHIASYQMTHIDTNSVQYHNTLIRSS